MANDHIADDRKKVRLIDANALLREVDRYFFWSADEVKHFIATATTVDAVEVVRCKDCKHYVQFLQDSKDCRCTIFSGCYDRPYPTDPDDFCSYGERRAE